MDIKYKTEWDLAKLFYKNAKDPQIEKDIAEIVRVCDWFEKKYRGREDYLADEDLLLEALIDGETLTAAINGAKPIMYFAYRRAVNSADKEAEAKENQLHDVLTKAMNKILFFDLDLAKIAPENRVTFLKSEKIGKYAYALKKTFDTAQYNLSEKEEKVINLMSHSSRGMWIDGVEKVQNKQTVRFAGEDIPVSMASEVVPTLPKEKRRKLHRLILEKLRDTAGDFAESELNALYTGKKIQDELRGFKEPYSATVLSYENDEKSILQMADTVSKAFPVAHKFFVLKAKLLGEKTLTYADRSASIGKIKKEFSPAEGIEMVGEMFKDAGIDYLTVFHNMMKNGQVDMFPRLHKSSGAFCSSGIGTPTMVMMNYTPAFRSVETLAHEMGHAVHAEFSKRQSAIYEGHTISVAETASTFFEGLIFDKLFDTLSDKEKVIALHDKIESEIATIFRQIACFNFELELHRKIRDEGFVSKEEIAKLMNKHMSAYLGKIVKMEELDGYFFIKWSHIRNFFYVYSYAYGQLISRAMIEKYKDDHAFIEKIGQFLSAGSSKSPEDIFKDIGIDTSKPEFFEEGIKGIENDIARLEKLVKNQKKRG